jgi:hypothetical protein
VGTRICSARTWASGPGWPITQTCCVIGLKIARPLQIPVPVQLWANFADPLDVVTLGTTLADDFGGGPRIIDTLVDNLSPNDHDSSGYLRAPQVRSRMATALSAGVG